MLRTMPRRRRDSGPAKCALAAGRAPAAGTRLPGERPRERPGGPASGGELSVDEPRVCLTRAARAALARLEPGRRAALGAAFGRVGRELLRRATRADVPPGWARRTWPRRRYPQQCYGKTVAYLLGHPEIVGLRLVHGVVSHGPRGVPLDHAWVELPGGIVFDGVVQAFFTHASYARVMAAVELDRYSPADAERLLAAHGHPGPWNAAWVPTSAQLRAYHLALRLRRGLTTPRPRRRRS
jgi:hypothetical protein